MVPDHLGQVMTRQIIMCQEERYALYRQWNWNILLG